MAETENRSLIAYLPGLLLCAALGSLAFYLGTLYLFKEQLHIGALLLVIILGILVRSFIPLPAALQAGIGFAQRPVLRAGVALLGFKLVFSELVGVGVPALVVVLLSTFATLGFGWWLGTRMGLDQKLATLLSVGTAICGASAIVAADSVVKSERKHVAASLGVVTLLGTLGIVLYPLIARFTHLDPFVFSVWDGGSLHEMAQVVAAGQAISDEAMKTATVVKLARICLLAPVVFYLAWVLRRHHEQAGEAKVAVVPWFLIVFVLFALINSLHLLNSATTQFLDKTLGLWILCVGMAGVGLQTGFKDLKEAGAKAILVGVLIWVFIAVLSFVLATLLLPRAG